jgi:hypothetical protein
MKPLFALACLLVFVSPGCASPGSAPKAVTAYVSIDEGGYPIFNLRKPGDSGNVNILATKEQIAKWKAAFAAYAQAQKELADAVDHYQPLAVDKKRIKK